jgi:hypothetical protein
MVLSLSGRGILMSEKYVRGDDATVILQKWRDHLKFEHQLPNECETIKELTWFIGEAIDGHVVLGRPKPKEEVS